jgi:hypothetical protein
MAKASANIETTVKINGATIELDENELMTLYAILNRVGGSPDKSYRKYTDSILYAIHTSIGVLNLQGYSKISSTVSETQRAIYFNDWEEK